ncbi:MAG TPA: NADPH-dependent oxidoreductase [Rhodobacteraceae bacterium]|nr:NADPH-dependent oxidoreductase [Paracoccaceae bacterium]
MKPTIFILCGSHRVRSQSARMGRHIAALLEAAGAVPDLFDLGKTPLPLWREDFWDSPRSGWEDWDAVAARLRAADGLVIVCPEYHGMVPAGVKNFFLLASARELADKPALIVTVSAATGGAYPNAELRMASAKNNRLCYMPDAVILRDVEKLFLDSDNPTEADRYLEGRLRHDLELLKLYAEAFRQIRAAGARDLEAYPFGM